MTRYIDIHIEVPGDPKEPFDQAKYLESLIKDENSDGIFFKDGAMIISDSSWHGSPLYSLVLRDLMTVLRIYVRILSEKVWHICQKVVIFAHRNYS